MAIVRVPTGILFHAFLRDGEKCLVLTKTNENNETEWQKKFSVKHLLNENYEVTEQTLEEEKRMFTEPIRV